MLLVEHLTAFARLVLAMSAWSVKPGRDVLRPGVVGMRGSMVIRLRPCMITTRTPPFITAVAAPNKSKLRCRQLFQPFQIENLLSLSLSTS